MKSQHALSVVVVSVSLFVVGATFAAQDKYSIHVPGGLAFSDFRGYEDWQTVSVSQTEDRLKLILANPAMIDAYQSGVPGNGKPFPDGAKMAKISWKTRANPEAPVAVVVPDTLDSIGFMEKDGTRFEDTGGWGYAQFSYDPGSEIYAPDRDYVGDAACGHACHSIVEAKDFVFSAYGQR